MAKKGALYAKIKIAGNILHLFNTHLQANYFRSSFHTYIKSIEYKAVQIKELAEFIDEKTKDMGVNDIILVMGDFNVSSRGASVSVIHKIKGLAERYPDYNDLLDLEFDFLKEYKIMMKLMSHNGTFKVKNLKECIPDANGEDPITFGDILDESNVSQSHQYNSVNLEWITSRSSRRNSAYSSQ